MSILIIVFLFKGTGCHLPIPHTELNISSAIIRLSCGSTRLCPVPFSLCLSEAKKVGKKWYHLSVEQPFYVEKPRATALFRENGEVSAERKEVHK